MISDEKIIRTKVVRLEKIYYFVQLTTFSFETFRVQKLYFKINWNSCFFNSSNDLRWKNDLKQSCRFWYDLKLSNLNIFLVQPKLGRWRKQTCLRAKSRGEAHVRGGRGRGWWPTWQLEPGGVGQPRGSVRKKKNREMGAMRQGRREKVCVPLDVLRVRVCLAVEFKTFFYRHFMYNLLIHRL